MKAFKVTLYGPEEGLPISTNPWPHVPVGNGVGTLVRVPVLGGEDNAKLYDATVTEDARGRVALRPADGEGDEALVLLDIQEGFRGQAYLRNPATTRVSCPERGMSAIS